MIKLRLDVDYPYPSRLQSFIFTALNIKTSRDYVKNSKIIAKMVNESPEEVMAYWFFTPQTTPDRELLDLMHPERHEVALHVATKPYVEWENLEKATGRKVKYYTVHGTARLLARLMWRRKLWEAKAPIPKEFPLKSFYDFPTVHLDRVCYDKSREQALQLAKESINKGEVLHVHPEWLFQRGTLNHRGPYYRTLKTLLQVDTQFDNLAVRKRGFAKVAKYQEQYEYVKDGYPSDGFLAKLAERGVDIYSFVERTWCSPINAPSSKWLRAEDNIALLQIIPYSEWLAKVGKKTRNMIRKAEKSGVKTEVVEASEQLAEGISRIFNETPIRQGRAFSHYGWRPQDVKRVLFATANSTFIGAYLEGELVGFVQLVDGDQITVMAQILSLQKHWDKALNNALVAKAVEVCAAENASWLMYGRMGNHPSLDNFKINNGFTKCTLTRYFVRLTKKGRLATKLGLHREAKDALPNWLKGSAVPVFNWISRTKVRIKR
ncbi:MAG: GNAT family N-acetyltransferase [Candidatus Bathyarchaeota archaeon]|nr:GNAT family N-acetyltransferase [Candidatus Bathyarchaeota archaeon]